MIVNIKDLEKSKSSKIDVVCDYCSSPFKKTLKDREKQNKVLDKDCCKDCKYKKREELSLLKHGVKNSAQRKDVVLSKIDWNSLKKDIKSLYENGNSITSISKKLQVPATSLSRKIKMWKFTNPLSIAERKVKSLKDNFGDNYQDELNKRKDKAVLEKFGTKNVFQNEEVKKKIRNSNIEKYGVSHHLKSEAVKEKMKETVKRRYGVENVAQLPNIRDKIESTNLVKYGYKNASKSPTVKKKIIDSMIKDGRARVYDGKITKELAEKTGYCVSRFNQLVRSIGIENAVELEKTSNKFSSLERFLIAYLDKENISYKQQFRIKKSNGNYYIADFKIDNLLIELDGLYWHSDKIIEDNNYHAAKKAHYDKNGYRSLFFREDEVYNKFEVVKSIIDYHLGNTSRVGARKCEIIELDTKAANKFFEENHLMGKGTGRTFALVYNSIFSSALRIKRVDGNNYEISRFCNSLGYSVTGGLSKLLKHVERNIEMTTLKTFIDRRYGAGDYLSSLGFTYKHCYPSFAWTDGEQRFHRMKFGGNSGYELGLSKIWDCGQAKWIKEY